MSKESDSDARIGPLRVRNSSSKEPVRYGRVLLKITGEALRPESRLRQVVREISFAARTGCELAVVVGGGNIIRGGRTSMIDRIPADHAGMVATVVNGIILQQLISKQFPCEHLCAFGVSGFVPAYSADRARAALNAEKVIVLSGGTGNPLFTTDTAAALRAREIQAAAIFKGTKVRGIFSADPKRVRRARFYPRLSYEQAMKQRLGIMDATAFALCAEDRMPIIVFDLFKPGNLVRAIRGESIGSKVC